MKKESLNLSGFQTVADNDYSSVSVNGHAFFGTMQCEIFQVSGAIIAGKIICTGNVQLSGSATLGDSIIGEQISVSGNMRTNNVEAKRTLSLSGFIDASGKVRTTVLELNGAVSCRELEAERVEGSGAIRCEGLLNAEEVDLAFRSRCTVGSIGAGTVRIRPDKGQKHSFLPGGADGFEVTEAIEADTAALEGVKAERVTCRIAAIGAGCTIDLLQYSETAEISPDATVKKCEKV